MKKRIILIPLIISCLINSAAGQKGVPDGVLDSVAYPLDTASYLNKNFLPPGLFLGKDIIGLGEGTHGTKEFYLMKDYIIRNQVLFNNVRALVIEDDFCGMLRFNDYLLDNSKPLQSLYQEFNKSGIYGIYFTREVYNLFRWIKTYNLKQSDNSEKVHVYGIDMQDPYALTKYILDEYSSLKQEDAGIYSELENINKLYIPRKEIKLKKEEIDKYTSLSDTIASLIKRNPQKKDDEILLRCIELLKQTFELRLHNNNINVKKRYDFYKNARELYMADNCLWVYHYLSKQWKDHRCKLVVWAHNGHVAFGSVDNDYPMGYFISKKIGNKYGSVGLLFGEGEVRIFDFDGPVRKYSPFMFGPPDKKNAIEYWLNEVKYPVFLLTFDQLKETHMDSFFSVNRYQRMIGAKHVDEKEDKYYVSMQVNKCFDGIIFIKKTTAAENVN